MAKRSVGVSSSAVLFGALGLYFVYVGSKDIPFLDGLRDLLRKKKPTPIAQHTPYTGSLTGADSLSIPTPAIQKGDSGIDRLVGNGRIGYNAIRAMGHWQILGWGLRPDLSSDHPKGLAIDVMHPTEAEAQTIIARFKMLPGAKYWIWNRQIANAHIDHWIVRHYTGPNPHTDHVHLSFE